MRIGQLVNRETFNNHNLQQPMATNESLYQLTATYIEDMHSESCKRISGSMNIEKPPQAQRLQYKDVKSSAQMGLVFIAQES